MSGPESCSDAKRRDKVLDAVNTAFLAAQLPETSS